MKSVLRNALSKAFIFVFIVLLLACAPKIVSFQAKPQRICKGQSTTVSWEVKGSGVLLAEPPTAGTGIIPSSGSQRFTLNDTTLFTLRVMRNGKDVFAKQEVVTFANKDKKKIVIKTKPDGRRGLVAVTVLRPEVWDDLIRIDTISGQSGRPLRVLHAGREVILPTDGSPSSEFKGLKLSGRWEIYSELLPGEVIGDPAHAPPDRLRILVNLLCMKE